MKKGVLNIFFIIFFLIIIVKFSLAPTSTNYHTNVTTINSGAKILNSTNYALTISTSELGSNLSTSENYRTSLGYIYLLNEAPIATTIPDQTWSQETDRVINLNDFFSDLDGDTLIYTSTTPTDITVTIDENVVTLTPNPSFYGTNTIQFTASDGIDTTQSNTITLTVTKFVKKEEPGTSYRGSTGPPLPSRIEFPISLGENLITDFPPDSALVSILINILSANPDAKIIAQEVPRVTVPRINAYTFLEILTFGILYNRAEITFKVSNNWIISENIDEDSITLMLFDELQNTWIPLTTEQLFSSQGYLYFKSSTSKLGTFAITAETKLFEPVKEEEKISAEIVKEIPEELPKITQVLQIKYPTSYIIAATITTVSILILIRILYREKRILKKIRKLISKNKFEKAEKLYRKIPIQEDIEYELSQYRTQKEKEEIEHKNLMESAKERIRQALNYGYTKKQIIKAFLEKGWDKRIIKDIFKEI